MLKRIALVCGALVLSLGVLEGALRALGLPRFDACALTPPYAVAEPELGFAPPRGGVVAGVQLNAMGLRGPLLSREKPADHRRLLFLGDSTCWGLRVSEAESFPARVATLLGRDAPKIEVEALNGAFPGYSSYHAAIVLERLLPFEPDLVVFYVGARNDSSRARYYADAEIPARFARRAAAWHQVHALRGIEVLRDLGYRRFYRKLLAAGDRARVPPAAFANNLRRMAERLRAARVPGLIVLPPISPTFAARHPIALEYRDILAAVATEFALPAVALQGAFDRSPDRPPFFEDGYHFTARGHEIAAREIRAAIRESQTLGLE